MDSKAAVERYLDEAGVPYTSVRLAAYCDNFASYFKAQPQPDGTYAITLPMNGPMYTIAVDDGGPVVASVFNNPGEFLGKKIGIAGDLKTIDEYATVINDLAYMFDFFARGNPNQDLTLTKRLNPNVLSFEEWAGRNKDKLMIVISGNTISGACEIPTVAKAYTKVNQNPINSQDCDGNIDC
ncbi:hypothetical protein EMCRGX_G000377 [Ephydatia muelleri]